MSNQNNASGSVTVDDAKVQRLLKKIIIAESRNLKSGEKSDKQMIKMIMDKIKELVDFGRVSGIYYTKWHLQFMHL